MQALWERYFAAMSEVSRQLMRIFAVGLGLDIDYFEDKIDRHICMFRALNYPDQPDEPLARSAPRRSALRLRQPDDAATGEPAGRPAGDDEGR